MNKRGYFSDLNNNMQTGYTYEATICPKTEFAIYDGNNRVMSKIRNETDDFIYYQPMTVQTNVVPNRYVIKNI
jgi:hypothetical protein